MVLTHGSNVDIHAMHSNRRNKRQRTKTADHLQRHHEAQARLGILQLRLTLPDPAIPRQVFQVLL
jgi:hypothetical protein